MALLTVAIYWAVFVSGQTEYVTAKSTKVQDNYLLLHSTKSTTSTENLTTSSRTSKQEESDVIISELVSTTIWPKTQQTSNEPINELEFTQQEIISEQTLLVTKNNPSETTNRLQELNSSSTEIPVEMVSATSTVSIAETITNSEAQTQTFPSLSVVLETIEPSKSFLETDNIGTSESETLTITDEIFVQNSAEISSDIPNKNDVFSSTTEFLSFPTTSWTPFKPNIPYYHCKEPGHFVSRPSCVEYHVCRRVGVWMMHFKARCHFGYKFSTLFRFCVPSYLSDCNTDPYLVDFSMKYDDNTENDNSSSEFDDDSGDCEGEELGELPF